MNHLLEYGSCIIHLITHRYFFIYLKMHDKFF